VRADWSSGYRMADVLRIAANTTGRGIGRGWNSTETKMRSGTSGRQRDGLQTISPHIVDRDAAGRGRRGRRS
jgi:hypothetical protein